jgi:hypothetical protein
MCLVVAAAGRNMLYMRTYDVFIPDLCRLSNSKHCLTRNKTKQNNISGYARLRLGLLWVW